MESNGRYNGHIRNKTTIVSIMLWKFSFFITNIIILFWQELSNKPDIIRLGNQNIFVKPD